MADGKLEFVGRVDDQVKIRGFRVELSDIEAQLLELPGIKESLVMLREDPPGIKKLVAYLVPDGTVDLMSGQLRNALNQRLPHYMVPHHYVQLAGFPKTPNNKVDRKQLPAPEASRAWCDSVCTLIHSKAYLQSVWIEVLGTATIGITDDFFDLGGDSLQAARITNQVEEWLGRAAVASSPL